MYALMAEQDRNEKSKDVTLKLLKYATDGWYLEQP